jgi:hypothetical protein
VANQNRRPAQHVPNEKRTRERFEIEQQLRYVILDNRGIPRFGAGKTINISSRGVCFTTQTRIPVGEQVELSIDWPVLLDGACRIKLVILGHVIRSSDNQAVLTVERSEFRTQGSRNWN